MGLSVYAQNPNDIVNIPDGILKAKLLEASSMNVIASNQPYIEDLSPNAFNSIDVNNDGEIQYSEASAIKWLDIGFLSVSDLTGLDSFVNLEFLDCEYTSNITSLNASYFPNLILLNCRNSNLTSLLISTSFNLKYLDCTSNNLLTIDIANLINLKVLKVADNQLTNLDVTGLINLTDIFCNVNQITTLNLSGMNLLKSLNCSNNLFTDLNLSGLNSLESLICNFNLITSLDVSTLYSLQNLSVAYNQLTELDLSALSNVTKVQCEYNMLTTLDVSHFVLLQEVICGNNPPLTSLFMKNGQNSFFTMGFFDNPNLTYICVNENAVSGIQDNLNFFNMPYCNVNSYCSFTPGGLFYSLSGANKLDTNSNGCDDTDIILPNLKFNITNGTQTGSFITNASGAYSIPVQAGTHTVTPVIENPMYFNISPASTTVTFPQTTSPFTQNFCVTPNGVHQDLEVTIIPMDAAIPGFDAHYKIVYRNIGNVNIAMGSMAFDYDDATLDYVSSAPTTEILPLGNLFWTFLNLQPFETRTIDVVFNLNSPTETPALNSGNLLTFVANVNTSVGEDTNPVDNVTTLQQLVVNSYDPNDKTCLEGTSITPDMIGKYVHYMIRFENTGTFPAQNIVVKDMIDESKFDVASLIPLNASHNYVTRISGNKVEFIFEGINLPFEDATNDGYVVFKIKTLPTLALGDSFSNSASIYFDYNFPIVTDPAVTTFATLTTQDFVFNNYLTVYPNPTNDVLNLTAKQAIELQSMAVYNVVGQLVLSVPNAKGVSTVDVSNLTAGTYFLKVVSDKGTSYVKFIKE